MLNNMEVTKTVAIKNSVCCFG